MSKDVHGRARELAAWCQWPQPQVVTAEELAMILKVPISWVWMTAREGRIPSYRLRRYLRFDLQEVLDSLRENGASKTINIGSTPK